MSLRQRLILLVTSACGALILLSPGGHAPTIQPGPLVSTAPPLFAEQPGPDDTAAMNALRREAGRALGQLQGKGTE